MTKKSMHKVSGSKDKEQRHPNFGIWAAPRFRAQRSYGLLGSILEPETRLIGRACVFVYLGKKFGGKKFLKVFRVTRERVPMRGLEKWSGQNGPSSKGDEKRGCQLLKDKEVSVWKIQPPRHKKTESPLVMVEPVGVFSRREDCGIGMGKRKKTDEDAQMAVRNEGCPCSSIGASKPGEKRQQRQVDTAAQKTTHLDAAGLKSRKNVGFWGKTGKGGQMDSDRARDWGAHDQTDQGLGESEEIDQRPGDSSCEGKEKERKKKTDQQM